MDDEGEATAKPAHTESAVSARRRTALLGSLGILIGVIAVSGAVIATLYATDMGDAGAGDDGAGEASTVWEHQFSDDYSGPVWITVSAPNAERCEVTISWGAWRRELLHTGIGPTAYLFTKDPGSTVRTIVEVHPAAVVIFGAGIPPEDAIDINDDWKPVDSS